MIVMSDIEAMRCVLWFERLREAGIDWMGAESDKRIVDSVYRAVGSKTLRRVHGD